MDRKRDRAKMRSGFANGVLPCSHIENQSTDFICVIHPTAFGKVRLPRPSLSYVNGESVIRSGIGNSEPLSLQVEPTPGIRLRIAGMGAVH